MKKNDQQTNVFLSHSIWRDGHFFAFDFFWYHSTHYIHIYFYYSKCFGSALNAKKLLAMLALAPRTIVFPAIVVHSDPIWLENIQLIFSFKNDCYYWGVPFCKKKIKKILVLKNIQPIFLVSGFELRNWLNAKFENGFFI